MALNKLRNWLHPLALFLVLGLCVNASLYPTEPVQRTVYTAGRHATIKWKDDGQDPSIDDAGSFRIDLYTADDTRISTLARHVPPYPTFRRVLIPENVDIDSALLYTLHFVYHDPPQRTIFSADFHIKAENDTQMLVMGSTTTSMPANTITETSALAPVTTVHADPLDGGPGDRYTSSSGALSLSFSMSDPANEASWGTLLYVLCSALIGIMLTI